MKCVEHRPRRPITTPLFVDNTDWSISLEPSASGTRIVQDYRVTQCPLWWEWIVVRANPRRMDRSGALTEDQLRIEAVAAAEAGTAGHAS
jgi:hypothetical protein